MDYWRKYFRSANSNIFDVIKNAIDVAAADWPQEFRTQRDQIAEKLFTSQLATCRGCDRTAEIDPPEEKERDMEAEEVEALTEETQEDSLMVQEVFRIKDTLFDKDHQSDSVLFESLKRLQSMELSMDVLKATEIGKAVNGLRKHGSREIRHLVRALIDGWKKVVDQWVHATAALTESTPESTNPRFSNQSTTSAMQFFDGTEDNRDLCNGAKNPPTSNGSSISEEKSADRRFFVELARKPQKAAADKCAIPEDSSVRAKLEAAKRKLHERYQQADNTKKQRTIQVMEIQDIPNPGKQHNLKQGSGGGWAGGRR